MPLLHCTFYYLSERSAVGGATRCHVLLWAITEPRMPLLAEERLKRFNATWIPLRHVARRLSKIMLLAVIGLPIHAIVAPNFVGNKAETTSSFQIDQAITFNVISQPLMTRKEKSGYNIQKGQTLYM